MFSYRVAMARTTGSHSKITGPKLRSAATGLFARHGYAAVSMRQIAAEVGVQAGALYNYIPDKQTLLFDLMRDHLQELLESQPQLPGDDPLTGLQSFLRFHIHFHHRRPDAVFIAYMELRNLEPENFRVIEDMRRCYEKRLQTIIDTGVRQGVFDVRDSKIATLAIIAMLTGVTVWFREGGRLSLEEVEDCYQDLARRCLGVVRPKGS